MSPKTAHRSLKVSHMSSKGATLVLRCPPKIPLRSPKVLLVPHRSQKVWSHFILVGERRMISFPTGRRAKRPAKRVSERVNTNKQKEQKRRCIFESFECQRRKNGEFLSKPLETGFEIFLKYVQRATFWADFPSNLLLGSADCRGKSF